MAMNKSLKRGFTLVELMIVVAIIGVLAALAIYGVRRYVYSSKTAEAKTAIGRIAKDASSAYNGESMEGAVLAAQGSALRSNRLCESDPTAMIPTAVPAAGKAQTAPGDWQAGKPAAGTSDRPKGFYCLSFAMQDPQMYSYGYSATFTDTGAIGAEGTFQATAFGDLDGDTHTSTFRLLGQALIEGGEHTVKIAPNFTEEDALE